MKLFDENCMYIQLLKDSLRCYRQNIAELNEYTKKVTLDLSIHTKLCTHFNVVKYVYRGKECPVVLLAIAGHNPPTLVVVKQDRNDKEVNQELFGWKVINEVTLLIDN